MYKPTPVFLKQLKKLEDVFRIFNGVELIVGNNYLSCLINNSVHVALRKYVKMLFFRCKMYFRIRLLNQEIFEKKLNTRKINKTIT